MPQHSVYFAAGRISMLRRSALDAGRLERLLTTSSYEEAKRTLSEIGWTGAEEKDHEQLAAEHVSAAAAILRELSTDERVTDCFLLRYDFANLKMLLKARCLGISAAGLSGCGTIPVDKLSRAVADRAYGELPSPIRESMEALEREMVLSVDPLAIDVKLDRCMFSMIFGLLKGTRCETALAYFRMRADILNAVALLRIRRMGREEDLFRSVLLQGGTITDEAWEKAFAAPETLPDLLTPYGTKVAEAARNAAADAAKLPALEKAMDNALIALFAPFKYDSMRIETLLGYLLGAEREAAAVRLIMAGKAGGFSNDAVRERLRDLYAG